MAATAATTTATAGATDELLIMSNREGGIFQLYTMSLDGQHLRRVLPAGVEATEFSLSPDGRSAAYISTRQGRPDLHVVDLESGRSTALTQDAALEATPVWSPDGRRIAFLSYRTGSAQLHIVNVDGSQLRRLTDGTGEESQPLFSPDGSKVLYTVKLDRREANLRTVDLATGRSTIVGLNPAKGVEIEAQWSPDGRRIAFVVASGDASNVFTMNADGSDRRAITSSDGFDRNNAPQWSDDGRQILFLGLRRPSTRQAIYLAQADGSQVRELIGGPAEHLVARFAPGSKDIVFVRFAARGGQIFAAGIDGSQIRRISDGKGYDADFALRRWHGAAQTTASR